MMSSEKTVLDLLLHLKLPEYATNLSSVTDIRTITDAVLQQLGIDKPGHRKRILNEVENFKAGAIPKAPVTPSRDHTNNVGQNSSLLQNITENVNGEENGDDIPPPLPPKKKQPAPRNSVSLTAPSSSAASKAPPPRPPQRAQSQNVPPTRPQKPPRKNIPGHSTKKAESLPRGFKCDDLDNKSEMNKDDNNLLEFDEPLNPKNKPIIPKRPPSIIKQPSYKEAIDLNPIRLPDPQTIPEISDSVDTVNSNDGVDTLVTIGGSREHSNVITVSDGSKATTASRPMSTFSSGRISIDSISSKQVVSPESLENALEENSGIILPTNSQNVKKPARPPRKRDSFSNKEKLKSLELELTKEEEIRNPEHSNENIPVKTDIANIEGTHIVCKEVPELPKRDSPVNRGSSRYTPLTSNKSDNLFKEMSKPPELPKRDSPVIPLDKNIDGFAPPPIPVRSDIDSDQPRKKSVPEANNADPNQTKEKPNIGTTKAATMPLPKRPVPALRRTFSVFNSDETAADANLEVRRKSLPNMLDKDQSIEKKKETEFPIYSDIEGDEKLDKDLITVKDKGTDIDDDGYIKVPPKIPDRVPPRHCKYY